MRTWIIILLFSIIVYFLLIKDSHIRVEYKLTHYLTYLLAPLVGTGGKFNRNRFEALYNHLMPARTPTQGKFVNGVQIEEVEIHSDFEKNLKDQKSFKVQLFLNENFAKNKNKNQKLPVLIYIHGGGFVKSFNYKNDIHFAKEGMLVVSIMYRLAPEHRFPTAVEDCYSTMIWLNDSQNSLIKTYADLERISIIGDSAGGNLAAILPHLLRERSFPRKISHQILVYPTMNTKEETESKTRLGKSAYILSADMLDWFMQQYIIDEEHYHNPLVNPMKNKDFSNIPQTLVLLATEDILYSEGKAYADLLRSKGVKVEIEEFKSVHGFYCIMDYPEEKLAREKIVQYFKRNKFIN